MTNANDIRVTIMVDRSDIRWNESIKVLQKYVHSMFILEIFIETDVTIIVLRRMT